MKYSISVPNGAKINKIWSKPAIDLNAKGPRKILLQDINPARGRSSTTVCYNGKRWDGAKSAAFNMPLALGDVPATPRRADTVKRPTTNVVCPPLSRAFCLGNNIWERRLVHLCFHKHVAATAKHRDCQFPSDTCRALDMGVRFQTVLQK